MLLEGEVTTRQSYHGVDVISISSMYVVMTGSSGLSWGSRRGMLDGSLGVKGHLRVVSIASR